MAHYPIVHIEISAHNNQDAAKWYQDVFGWETQEFPEMQYTTFRAAPIPGANGMGGGFATVSDFNPAGRVVIFIGTDDIRATMDNISAKGGTFIGEFLDVPTVGTIAYFADPTGNVLGLIQPEPGSGM
jgi:predicted enzyme related to lactoylglutathione lyase